MEGCSSCRGFTLPAKEALEGGTKCLLNARVVQVKEHVSLSRIALPACSAPQLQIQPPAVLQGGADHLESPRDSLGTLAFMGLLT